MQIEKRIHKCSHLTPVENEIAHYILSHKDEVINYSIQELSEQIHVSKSAIHRFCKKIDFKGFNELKIQLTNDISADIYKEHDIDINYPFTLQDNPIEIATKLLELYEKTIQDTLSCLDKQKLVHATKLMSKATSIDIYTHAHNMNIAKNFQDKMLTIGKMINCPESFYEQRLHALASNKNHIALILSYSAKASFILPILQKLNEKNTPCILVSGYQNNPFPQYICEHLGMSNCEELQDRIVQYSSHIALQYVMDILFGCIYNQDRSTNKKYVLNAMDYMDDRKL